MRLNINLASRKYEDVRQFFLRWSVAVGVLAASAVLLAALAGWSYNRSIKSGRHIKELQQEVAGLEKERQRLIDTENSPANRDATDQKRFWNYQIAKRKFSWTQLLNDLQRIMPSRASLVSVQPELQPDRRLMLKLIITGDNGEDALELVKRMEASQGFHGTFIKEQRKQLPKDVRAGMPSVTFEIDSEYIPGGTIPAHTHQPRAKEGI
jgi:hypothetical protein